jgi:hypothetical protein
MYTDLPKGWETGGRNKVVSIPILGMDFEVSAIDGKTRIKGFAQGGPAEEAELLFEGVYVCMCVCVCVCACV